MTAQAKKEIKKKTGQKDVNGTLKLILFAVSILLVTFLSFSTALKNGFINWDDNAYVFDNPHLSEPASKAVSYFFGQHYFIGNYIPLTMIVYLLEYKMAGLKPQFYHTVNLLIHLMNVILVFWFIYRLSGKRLFVAALVSLFFGIHPMHVESVAWVAELKDVLYTCFFMAGLIAYWNYLEKHYTAFDPDIKTDRLERQHGKNLLSRIPVLALFFFTLSVLSKPAAVVFPLVLLLIDFYTRRKFNARVWLEKLPFLIISILFGVIAIQAQQADRLIHDDFPYVQRLLFASHSFMAYFLKFFVPVNLSIFYPYPQLVHGSLPLLYYLAPLGVALLFYAVFRSLKHSRLVAFGFLFFLVNLILVLQLISVGDAVMAERYTYIPYIGLLFVLAVGFDTMYHSMAQKQLAYRPYLVAAVAVSACACVYLTHVRCKVWKDDDTVATDLLNKFPEDRLALNNKGFILYAKGRYEEARTLFIKAVQLKPDYTRAYINLINTNLALNDVVSAQRTADTALSHVRDDHYLLNKKGYMLLQEGNYREAIKMFERSIAVKSESVDTYIDLSQCYYALKDYESGIKTVERALRFEPENYILLNNKGYFLFLMKKYEEAEKYFEKSLSIKPGYSVAEVNLADCYKAMKNSPEKNEESPK